MISEKEWVSETLCQRQKLFSENKHTAGSSACLCVTHTHTHTRILLMTGLVQKITVLCKETQQTHGEYCLLKALLNTLSTGWYNYGLALEVAKKRILEAWLLARHSSVDDENSKEDWAVVLESWNGSRRLAAQFQGIPSWVYWYYQFPRRRLERS